MKVYEESHLQSAAENDIKREMPISTATLPWELCSNMALRGAKAFYEMFVLDPEHARAHDCGDIHIHDLDFFSLTTTCCQIDLTRLFAGGFNCGYGYLREPEDIADYAALAYTAIQANQNDQHGGQSVPKFDFDMAPVCAKPPEALSPLSVIAPVSFCADWKTAQSPLSGLCRSGRKTASQLSNQNRSYTLPQNGKLYRLFWAVRKHRSFLLNSLLQNTPTPKRNVRPIRQCRP